MKISEEPYKSYPIAVFTAKGRHVLASLMRNFLPNPLIFEEFLGIWANAAFFRWITRFASISSGDKSYKNIN